MKSMFVILNIEKMILCLSNKSFCFVCEWCVCCLRRFSVSESSVSVHKRTMHLPRMDVRWSGRLSTGRRRTTSSMQWVVVHCSMFTLSISLKPGL